MCTIHQNAKLSATTCQWEYKEMMHIIVCDAYLLTCVVHRCSDCPGKNALVFTLQQTECLEEISEVIIM